MKPILLITLWCKIFDSLLKFVFELCKLIHVMSISLLPIASKIFERFLLEIIIKDANAVSDRQFGFHKGHLTIQQSHPIADAVNKVFEAKPYCSAVFPDVSHAFDKVLLHNIIYL